MYCSGSGVCMEDSSCGEAMARMGSSAASGMEGGLRSAPGDCAKAENGSRQRARNHGLIFTKDLRTARSGLRRRGSMVILQGHSLRIQKEMVSMGTFRCRRKWLE